MVDSSMHIDLPPPTIIEPIQLWTGKQIFNVLMRPNRQSKVMVNVDSKCNAFQAPKAEDFKRFRGNVTPLPDLSPNDGWLVVVNSEVMSGVMD